MAFIYECDLEIVAVPISKSNCEGNDLIVALEENFARRKSSFKINRASGRFAPDRAG